MCSQELNTPLPDNGWLLKRVYTKKYECNTLDHKPINWIVHMCGYRGEGEVQRNRTEIGESVNTTSCFCFFFSISHTHWPDRRYWIIHSFWYQFLFSVTTLFLTLHLACHQTTNILTPGPNYVSPRSELGMIDIYQSACRGNFGYWFQISRNYNT